MDDLLTQQARELGYSFQIQQPGRECDLSGEWAGESIRELLLDPMGVEDDPDGFLADAFMDGVEAARLDIETEVAIHRLYPRA